MTDQIKHTEFIGSFTDIHQCPKRVLPEYAFIGRSNVGKSSLINRLVGKKNIARVSKSPGKTQTINFFLADDQWYLVDLPGYGFAKVSKKLRKDWDRMIFQYLQHRSSLVTAFVLIDARIEPQKADLHFMQRLGQHRIPFVMAFTKSDKIKRHHFPAVLKKFRSEMKAQWKELPPHFFTSSQSGAGIDELRTYIRDLNQNLNNERK